MAIPFIGRLNPFEYLALIGSFCLVGLEAIIRILTLALPHALINLCYRASRRLFNRLTSPAEKKAEQRRNSISTSIRDASDFVDLCRMFGYEAEEHVIQTKDGYLLCAQRLAWKNGEEGQRVNRGPDSLKKKVVYLHHGLLMNSEVWVCLTDAQRALPFVLVEQGYDVWLGNNRGNKYSKKSVYHAPTTTEFWNFSMDEFAFHDIPDTISYILDTTGQERLSYIGFSQGTAQAFATLAIHPKLNDQVNVFIALAPAMSPAGLSNGIVDSLVKASPQVLFLLFGRRSILSSATMWQNILYPPIFVKIIDYSLAFLFNWRTKNISLSQKLAAYPHLYSFTSTKSVVHWFQVLRNKAFQMYDDDVQQHMSLSTSSKYTKVARYPTRNIKTPIVLVYGGSDSLVDIKVMLRELPSQTVATEIPHYEHLDFLWARDVELQVFPHVFDALESFTDTNHSRDDYARYQLAREQSLAGSGHLALARAPKDSESEPSSAVEQNQDGSGAGGATSKRPVTPGTPSGIPVPQHRAREGLQSPQEVSPVPPILRTPTRRQQKHYGIAPGADEDPSSPSYEHAVDTLPLRSPLEHPHSKAAHATSNGIADPIESPATKLKGRGVRRESGGSVLSLDTGRGGISIGQGKAVGGVVTTSGADARGLLDKTSAVDDDGNSSGKGSSKKKRK